MIGLALVALVLWGVFLLLRWIGDRVRHRRREPRPEQVDFDVLDDPEPLAEEIRADAADQLALLLGGSPRNAIVACWDRFEEQAERVARGAQGLGDLVGVHAAAARAGLGRRGCGEPTGGALPRGALLRATRSTRAVARPPSRRSTRSISRSGSKVVPG